MLESVNETKFSLISRVETSPRSKINFSNSWLIFISFDIVAAELTKDNVTLKMKGDTIKKVTATLKDNNGKEKKYKLKSGTDYDLVSDNKVLSFKGNYKGTLAVDQATKK